jgi:hypothetical protein
MTSSLDMPLAFYLQGNGSKYPLYRTLAGLKSQSGHYGEENAPAGN